MGGTINTGLMYQVINPAFEHLAVSWYWAVPYIIALAIMRNLPMKAKRSRIFFFAGSDFNLFSTSYMNILPSPTFPVYSDFFTVLTTVSTGILQTMISI